MNCKYPTEKRLGASASEIVGNTIGSLEKVISSVCRIKIKVWATNARGAMNSKNSKKWLNAIDSEPKSTRRASSDVAVALTPVLNIAKKVTITRR